MKRRCNLRIPVHPQAFSQRTVGWSPLQSAKARRQAAEVATEKYTSLDRRRIASCQLPNTTVHRGRHIKIIGGQLAGGHGLPPPSPSLPYPSPPLPSSPPTLPSLSLLSSPPLPSRPLEVGPLFAARGCGGALKLPHWVRAEPGRQTFSGAF